MVPEDNISTHSLTRRLTRLNFTLHTRMAHFNSQPHEEADKKQPIKNADQWISTHSLTRRLTESDTINIRIMDYFNSQPHEEADR